VRRGATRTPARPLAAPGQEILQRSSVILRPDEKKEGTGWVLEVRARLALPAQGRSIQGHEASRIVGRDLVRELEEAALLDGASKVRVFFTLILPMAKAPISTLAILTYITAWNDYFWPLLVSYTDSSRVLTVALAVFRSQAPQTGPDWAGLMAATLVAALPMLLLFMAFARRIVNSIGFTGIK